MFTLEGREQSKLGESGEGEGRGRETADGPNKVCAVGLMGARMQPLTLDLASLICRSRLVCILRPRGCAVMLPPLYEEFTRLAETRLAQNNYLKLYVHSLSYITIA